MALVGGALASGLLGKAAVVPQTDGVNSTESGDARSKHYRGTTMEHYAGIDVSLECSSVCVLDASGKIIREAKVTSEPEALINWFRSLGYELSRIGLEAGPCRSGFLQRCAKRSSGRTTGDTARAQGVRGDAGEVGPQ